MSAGFVRQQLAAARAQPGPAPADVVEPLRRTAATPPKRFPSKRLFDSLSAFAALALFLPVMALIWVAVRATSRGPGLYWSQRVGRGGRLFWMPKFRTMHVSAPLTPREQLRGAERHLTPIGDFLRRSSLDELPQLWCILIGDMSVVGPRPLIPSDPASAARLRYPAVAGVRPGLTGLAQVNGRNSVTPSRKARFDDFYARNVSWGIDLRVLVRTVVIVFKRAHIL